MLWQAIGAARDLARAHEIATVLIRYGFSDLVRRIGLGNALEKTGRALHWHGGRWRGRWRCWRLRWSVPVGAAGVRGAHRAARL